MKKSVLAVLIFILLVFAPIARAQEFNFDKSYSDYLYSRSVYDKAFSDYTKARDFYLSNQTLTLKEDARKKILAMLRERDQLFIVYLTALRMKIFEIDGLTGDDKNGILGKIDGEVSWYKGHKENYRDGDPLEDLFNKSDEGKSRYSTHTLPLIYDSLFSVTYGEEKTIRLEQENIYSTLKSVLDENIKSGALTIDPFTRWFSDIDLIIKNLIQNDDLAKTQIQKVYSQSFSIVSSYNTSLSTLASSLTLLGQLNQFLIEVLTSIRNQI